MVSAESRIDVGRYGDAYRLVRQLEEQMPHDAEIQQALLRLTYPSNVRPIPPGAEVYQAPQALSAVSGRTMNLETKAQPNVQQA